MLYGLIYQFKHLKKHKVDDWAFHYIYKHKHMIFCRDINLLNIKSHLLFVERKAVMIAKPHKKSITNMLS